VINAVDWFVQDTSLAAIRASSSAARLLNPLSTEEQSRWEAANYAVALLALAGLGVVWQVRKRSEQPIELLPPMGKPLVIDLADEPEEGDE